MTQLQAPHTLRSPLGTVACPEPGCFTRAEVIARFVLSSTDGPVAHMRTRCERGHVRTPLATTPEEIQ
jgi:hypothetical protein